MLTAGLLSLSLIACSDDEDSVLQPSGNNSLNGIWTSGCLIDDDGDGSIRKITISGISFQSQNDVFSDDSSCNTRTIQIGTSGSFVTGAEVPLATGAPATQVDICFQSGTVTYFGANIVNNVNTNNVCGRSNWQDGVSQDATACLQLPSIDYDIFRVDGNTVYFGDNNSSGQTPETRPTGLDLTAPYTR